MQNQKPENCVLLGELLRISAWDTASQIVLRDCYEEIREEPGYTRVFRKKKNFFLTSSMHIKRLVVFKEN